MPDPRDHSQSGSESRGAERFWGDYARQSRGGGERREASGTGPGPGPGDPGGGPRPTGNGHSAGAGPAFPHEHGHQCVEWCPICRTADVLRASASPEMRDQLQSLQQDAVETLRSLAEAYLERIGDRPEQRAETRVEDIPIE